MDTLSIVSPVEIRSKSWRKTSAGVLVGERLAVTVGRGVEGVDVGVMLGLAVGRLVGNGVGARVGLGDGPMGLGALDLVMVGARVGTGFPVGLKVHPSPKLPPGKGLFKPPLAFGFPACCWFSAT